MGFKPHNSMGVLESGGMAVRVGCPLWGLSEELTESTFASSSEAIGDEDEDIGEYCGLWGTRELYESGDEG